MTARFIHNVYFWLRDNPQPDDARLLAEGCRKYLPSIPGVLRLETGVPAGTPRDVVDNSFGVALIVEFADAAGQDVYEHHPEHMKFIEACHHLWSRVVVYDTLLP